MTTAETILQIKASNAEEVKAKLVLYGKQLALDNPRKNDRWDIVWAMPVPVVPQKGCLPCEIVIGNRHTEFQPFVAWHCFGGNSYAWGAYCQTFEGAFECAMDKMCREIGLNIEREER